MSASQEAKAFVAGRIVPNFEAIDDRTRQVPFYGILTEHGGQTRIKFFYARPRSVDTPAPLSLIALSAKKPRQEYALPSTIAETAI